MNFLFQFLIGIWLYKYSCNVFLFVNKLQILLLLLETFGPPFRIEIEVNLGSSKKDIF